MTESKRHHQVPRFYLERFASGGRVAVRRRDGRMFEADPVNVAVESGFYDLPDGAGGKSKTAERMLSEVEDAAARVLRTVDRANALPDAGTDDRQALALLIAFQMTRTTEHRERTLFPRRVAEWAGGRDITHELVAEFLETEHLGFRPNDREVDGAWLYVTTAMEDPEVTTPEFDVRMMLDAVAEMLPRLLGLTWTIEVDRRHEFITSDMPVITWRKPTYRDNFEGVGIDKSTEVRFPLDPQKCLILSRRSRLPSIEVAVHRVRRINADLAAACHRFIVGSPGNRAQIDAQRLHEWRPVVRFNVGPLFMAGPDGTMQQAEGEVMHMWIPRRADLGRPTSDDLDRSPEKEARPGVGPPPTHGRLG